MPKKVVIEDEDDLPVPVKKDVVLPKSKKVVIEDEDDLPIPVKKDVVEVVEETPQDPGDVQEPLPPRIPLAHYKPEENLYLIKGTNVVFSYSLAMVIGFVYQSVFIQAPIKEVREVCGRYKLSYLGDVLKELDITREK
jgi:hypothetical protein